MKITTQLFLLTFKQQMHARQVISCLQSHGFFVVIAQGFEKLYKHLFVILQDSCLVEFVGELPAHFGHLEGDLDLIVVVEVEKVD